MRPLLPMRNKLLHVLLTAFLAVGCATTGTEWESYQKADTVCGYREFIRKHPGSGFAKYAEARIEELDWQETLNEDNEYAYRKFQEKYPRGRFVPMVNEKIELIEWQKTRTEDSYAAYRVFLMDYPESRFAREAREEIEWEIARSQDTREAYENFIGMYPGSAHTEEAETGMEVLDWKAARNLNTVGAYKSYLNEHPDGQFAADAEKAVRLKEMIARCNEVSQIMGDQIEREVSNYIAKEPSIILNVKNFRMNIIGLSENKFEIDMTEYVSTQEQGVIRSVYYIADTGQRKEEAAGILGEGKWNRAEKVVRHKTVIEPGSTIILRDGRIFVYSDGKWYLCL